MVTPRRPPERSGRDTITLPVDDGAVAAMVAFVHRFCTGEGLGEPLAARLSVVLEELMTNSIKYAFDDRDRHDVRIGIAREGDAVTVIYEDDGRPFDPFAVAAPSFETPVEEWPIGRLGVHLIRFLTDKVSYARDGRSNRITLVKELSGADPT